MPASPAISVVIPTLNEAGRIGGLIRALQAQREAPEFEIFVSDGGSTDGTANLARSFEGVQVLEGIRGVSRQRNAGADAARGELLVFLDADDVPPPQFLARVWKSYRRLPFAVACPWFVAVDGGLSGKFCYWLFNLGFFMGQSTLRMGSGVCLICPRERFLRVGGFDTSLHLGEDVHLIHKLCPRHGLHRHLLVPLGTSARRFEHHSTPKLMLFYALITPCLLLGWWRPLQKLKYEAAPYDEAAA